MVILCTPFCLNVLEPVIFVEILALSVNFQVKYTARFCAYYRSISVLFQCSTGHVTKGVQFFEIRIQMYWIFRTKNFVVKFRIRKCIIEFHNSFSNQGLFRYIFYFLFFFYWIRFSQSALFPSCSQQSNYGGVGGGINSIKYPVTDESHVRTFFLNSIYNFTFIWFSHILHTETPRLHIL